MIIIGITGTIGAGKGTVVDYLAKEKGFTVFSVSEFLAEEARRRGMTPDRIARRDIANEYRARSPVALQEAVFEQAKASGAERIILDPQHTVGEVGYIKSIGGLELAVDADLDVRFERIQKRGSPKDNVTYEEFVREQTHEMQSNDPNKNNLAASIQAADYLITNNGTLEELHAQIEKVLQKIGIT